MKSRLHFLANAPFSVDWKEDCLLIYDQRLSRMKPAAAWIRKFKNRYGVEAGEKLKDVREFPAHMEKISGLVGDLSSRRLTIVVAGGGSVGDFGGFVASIFKRGVKLVHVPTTWLAALDSSHGGKTGLNVAGVKNQVGTFYPATEIYLVRSLLETQPIPRAVEAAAEVLKIALLTGLRFPAWKESYLKDPRPWMWGALKPAIKGKYSIVQQDPLEKKGLRHLLNFGHTMGHAFEAALKLPHGMAVAYGLVFASTYSRAQRIASEKDYTKIIASPLWGLYLPSATYYKCLAIPPARLKALLLQDKKRTQKTDLRFIFLKAVGKPMIREISVSDLLVEVKRQEKMLRKLYA